MPELTDVQIQKIIQDAQAAAQQAAAQVLQAAQQTGGSLAADKKVLGTTVVTEDTQTDEATRGKTYVDSEMWGLNKKLITEREQTNSRRSEDRGHFQDSSSVALKALKELAQFEHEQKMKHIEVLAGYNLQVFNHALNMEYAKFNAAVSEPINPNIGRAEALRSAKAAAKKK